MTSTNSENGQAQPNTTTPQPTPRPVNHRLANLKPLALNTNGVDKNAPAPFLDEKLEAPDLRLSIHVKLNDRTEPLADITMERIIPEGKMEKNRWVLLKAVEDLIATACQGTALKLEAKLGSARPQNERHLGQDASFENDFRREAGASSYRPPGAEPAV